MTGLLSSTSSKTSVYPRVRVQDQWSAVVPLRPPLLRSVLLGRLGLDACGGFGVLPEPVLESPAECLHVLHAPRAVGSPPQRLLAPVVAAHLGAGVAAGAARGLLDVERLAAAADAQRVRVLVPATETERSLRLSSAHTTHSRGNVSRRRQAGEAGEQRTAKASQRRGGRATRDRRCHTGVAKPQQRKRRRGRRRRCGTAGTRGE